MSIFLNNQISARLNILTGREFGVRNLSANIIKHLHNGVLIVALTGWLYGDTLWLLGYLVLLTVILCQWILNDNRCVLTVVENNLRGHRVTETPTAESTFVGQIWKKWFGYTPTYTFINRLSYAVVVFLMIITILRLRLDI